MYRKKRKSRSGIPDTEPRHRPGCLHASVRMFVDVCRCLVCVCVCLSVPEDALRSASLTTTSREPPLSVSLSLSAFRISFCFFFRASFLLPRTVPDVRIRIRERERERRFAGRGGERGRAERVCGNSRHTPDIYIRLRVVTLPYLYRKVPREHFCRQWLSEPGESICRRPQSPFVIIACRFCICCSQRY